MTEAQFYSNIDYLRKKAPTHSYLDEIQTGFSLANVAYLNAALSQLDKAASVADQRTSASQEAILQKLFIQKSKLFVQRAKLSNAMLAFPTGEQYNEKRKEYSNLIYTVQAEIETIFDEIDYEQGVKKRVEKRVSETHKTDGLSLAKKQNSLRAAISRKKKKIMTMEGTKKEIEIKKMADLQQQLDLIHERIKNYDC